MEEQYDNKDVLTQIYHFKDIIESGTLAEVEMTEVDGVYTLRVQLNDGTEESLTWSQTNQIIVGDDTPTEGLVGQLWWGPTAQTLYVCTDETPTWTAIISGTGLNVNWGNIVGTLSDQLDLVSALGAKADTADLATVATSGDYDDLLNKPTIPVVPPMTHEEWTFTLADDTTVTKDVMLYDGE